MDNINLKKCTLNEPRWRKALSTNFLIQLEIPPQHFFDVIVLNPIGTLELYCVQIGQLVTAYLNVIIYQAMRNLKTLKHQPSLI